MPSHNHSGLIHPTMFFIRPAKNIRIADPKTGDYLPESGAYLPRSGFWLRRLKDGDVIDCSEHHVPCPPSNTEKNSTEKDTAATSNEPTVQNEPDTRAKPATANQTTPQKQQKSRNKA